jgi:DNA-binding IclR family transcriptional regulator
MDGDNQDLSKPQARQGVDAVERALSLLRCFEKSGEELTLALLAQRSGLYKSTILRLSASLVHMGFLQRSPSGLFRLGSELRRLGQLSSAKVPLASLVRPALADLTAKTQETASFYVRDGDERICLYRVNSPRAMRHHLDEGTRRPLLGGAAGYILWAFDPDAPLDAEMTRVRNRGWVFSEGRRDPDLGAVAVPLLNRQGELLGALSVSGLRSRFTAAQVALVRGLLLATVRSLRDDLPSLAFADFGMETDAAN